MNKSKIWPNAPVELVLDENYCWQTVSIKRSLDTTLGPVTWTVVDPGDASTFDIVDLDGNPHKITGSYTFKCDCNTSQLMIKGCTCGGL